MNDETRDLGQATPHRATYPMLAASMSAGRVDGGGRPDAGKRELRSAEPFEHDSVEDLQERLAAAVKRADRFHQALAEAKVREAALAGEVDRLRGVAGSGIGRFS